MIRDILAAILFLAAALSVITAILGVYRFHFVLNRMHSAAIIDTMALSFILTGLMILTGSLEFIPKLFLILLIQWLGSPIASHMVGRLEISYDPRVPLHMTFENKEETK